MIKKIPLNRLLIGTDSPFSTIKNNFAGNKYVETVFPMAKIAEYRIDQLVLGRNEPCTIV